MLNKKILAVTLAGLFAASANATIDTNTTTASAVGTITVASEGLGTAVASGTNEGMFVITNAASALDVTAQVGFAIPATETRYVRFDLTNGAFNATGAVSLTGASVATAQGGAAGDDFIIVSVTENGSPAASIAGSAVMTLAAATYAVPSTGGLSVEYSLYETAGNAVNKTDALSTSSATMINVATASTGTFTVSDSAVATVASQFKAFSVDATGVVDTATVAGVAAVDATKLLSTASAGYLLADGATSVLPSNIIGAAAQDVIVTGNLSFGDWAFHNATCAGADTSIDADTGVANIDVDANVWALCVTVDGTDDVVAKGSYSVALDGDNKLSNANIGSISFDTTSIEIPYITTFKDYNQRIYIKNTGSVDASFTTTFVTESGTTATAGSKATGTVPAGEIYTIKATDLVTFTGSTTRGSATIEIEAEADNVTATTQTVNSSDSSTDTVTLVVE